MSAEGIGVLVGLDESACSLEALAWGAADAAARRASLTIATVVDLPLLAEVRMTPELLGTAREVARRRLDEAVRRTRDSVAGLVIEGRVLSGNPAAELLRVAAGADEVVVGSHGTSEISALLIGSVGSQVAEHSPCPAVVVRSRPRSGSVVVGIENSKYDEAALEYGFGYADRHGLPVVALHVYTLGAFVYPVMPYPVPPYPITEELARIRAAAAQITEEVVAKWTEKYPDVPMRVDVVEGPAAHELVEASRKANLLVVGTHGHGGLAGMLLGSVSHAVMRHAHCPVAIAR